MTQHFQWIYLCTGNSLFTKRFIKEVKRLNMTPRIDAVIGPSIYPVII